MCENSPGWRKESVCSLSAPPHSLGGAVPSLLPRLGEGEERPPRGGPVSPPDISPLLEAVCGWREEHAFPVSTQTRGTAQFALCRGSHGNRVGAPYNLEIRGQELRFSGLLKLRQT